jgi:release factor glutamine methyltransferase
MALSDPVPSEVEAHLAELVTRRLRGEPIPYILGHREFFGLDFIVDRRGFIPGWETEMLVEEALDRLRRWRARPEGWLVADVGTGSGAVAVSLAVNHADAKIVALDLSRDALDLARENAQRHGVLERVTFLESDLTLALDRQMDLIVANLPYVDRLALMAVGPEGPLAYVPMLALDGGCDGLEIIERFLGSVGAKLSPEGSVLMEIGSWQGPAVVEMARASFPEAKVTLAHDLAGRDRIVAIDCR